MQYRFYMPVRIVGGENCVSENGSLFKAFGKCALIVTGRSSAKNGALADVTSALIQNGQTYAVFDEVTPNPTVPCVRAGVQKCKECGADFIVAIGGGSPMDAAKAIAILAREERSDDAIFAGNWGNDALPMVHIPTTCGTGSEVTPYSILTNDKAQTKTSIAAPVLFPKVAFLDGKYMRNLPIATTVNTALDAMSHAMESLLSVHSDGMSGWAARESLRMLGKAVPALLKGVFTAEDRDTLLYASCLAGIAIAQTGTTIVHSMGYNLTYYYGIDHGRANGILLSETLRLAERKVPGRIREIVEAMGEGSLQAVTDVIDALVGKVEYIPPEVLPEWTKKAFANKNLKKCAYLPTEEEISVIYHKSLYQ